VSEQRWVEICEQERAVALDASSVCHPVSTPSASPIDNFYAYVATLIPLGDAKRLASNDALGKALLLGIVSATEHYFRAVLAGLIHACPLTRKQAASLSLSFGAVDYYSREDLGLGLFEHASLASAGEIRKHTQKLIGVQISQDASAEAAFEEYEKLCQLRHAAVHARGDLSHQNLQELGVNLTSGRLGIKVELPALHSAAAVCQNVVRAYNRLLYRKTVERWIAERVFSGSWLTDRDRFDQIWALFHSRSDGLVYMNAYHTYRNLLPTLSAVLTKK
jgi:hypothetical protein